MRTRVALSVRTILLYVWTEEKKKGENNNNFKYILFTVLENFVYTHMVLTSGKIYHFHWTTVLANFYDLWGGEII